MCIEKSEQHNKIIKLKFIFLRMKNNIKVKGKNNKIKLYELNNKFSPK